MANWNTLQDKFTQGELSPLLYGQNTNAVTAEGAQLMLNGFVVPQGPVITRPGTTYLTTLDALTQNIARTWQFIGPENNDLFAVFSDDEVRVLDWQGGIIDGTTSAYTQLISNSTFTTGLATWDKVERSTMSPDFYPMQGDVRAQDGVCEMTVSSTSTTQTVPNGFESPIQELKRQDVTPVEAEEIVLQLSARQVEFDINGGALERNDWDVYVRVSLGTTLDGVEIGTQTYTLEYLTTRLFSLNINLGAGFGLAPGTTIYTRIEYFAGTTADAYGPFQWFWQAQIDDVVLLVRPVAAVVPIVLTTVYTADDLEDLHFVQSPFDNRELIVLHPNYPPQALYYEPVGGNWEFNPYTFTNAPLDWGVNGKWPSIGAGAQGRLYLSGLETHPETIWASKVYDWRDFDLGVADPTDALSLTGIERDVNTWIISGKSIQYGDRRREYSLNPNGNIVSPSDVQISAQSSFGTERNPQKITMGKSVVLATGGNNDLRLSFYNRDDGGFIAPNIILKAEHLGKKEFKRHFYTRDPNQTLWSVMKDGTVILCSFDDEYNVQAWSRFESPGGFIIDGCVVNDAEGRDVVILLVVRTVDGVQVVNIETVNNLRDVNSWGIVDAAVVVLPEIPDDGPLEGFEALEGNTVAVFLDGSFDSLQIVNNGEINVAEASARVVCGVPYAFKLTTFPQASLIAEAGITSKKRFSKIGVRGLFSLPPIINGKRPPDRSPQSMMNISELPQEFIDTDVVGGSTNETGVVTIEEVTPVRLTIAAIYGKLTSNQL